MSAKSTDAESVLVTFEDILNELAEELGELPESCESCSVYSVLATFAAKLRKAKLHEEAEIVRKVRDKYNI